MEKCKLPNFPLVHSLIRVRAHFIKVYYSFQIFQHRKGTLFAQNAKDFLRYLNGYLNINAFPARRLQI
jgi:hypothetical protein